MARDANGPYQTIAFVEPRKGPAPRKQPPTGVITFEEKKAAVKRIPASKPPEALDDESWAVQEFNEHKAMYEQLGHTLEDVKKQAPRLRSRQRPQLTGRGREQM